MIHEQTLLPTILTFGLMSSFGFSCIFLICLCKSLFSENLLEQNEHSCRQEQYKNTLVRRISASRVMIVNHIHYDTETHFRFV
jgi:hypothetical protein